MVNGQRWMTGMTQGGGPSGVSGKVPGTFFFMRRERMSDLQIASNTQEHQEVDWESKEVSGSR